MASNRLVWSVILLAFAAMAATGPYKMLREGAPDPAQEAASEEASTVAMAGLAFAPREMTVDRGTEVLFDNDDLAPHTVTADDGSVDSGTLNPGKAFRLSVDTPLEYHCEIHPSMTGRILVSG